MFVSLIIVTALSGFRGTRPSLVLLVAYVHGLMAIPGLRISVGTVCHSLVDWGLTDG